MRELTTGELQQIQGGVDNTQVEGMAAGAIVMGIISFAVDFALIEWINHNNGTQYLPGILTFVGMLVGTVAGLYFTSE